MFDADLTQDSGACAVQGTPLSCLKILTLIQAVAALSGMSHAIPFQMYGLGH